MPRRTVEQRFWAKVRVGAPDECWEWTRCKAKGYGKMNINHRYVLAHRFSYELAHGPIEPGLFVCHTCDNKSCVNPRHLVAATPTDNMRDMLAKGRCPGPIKQGEAHFMAKLTWEKVREIRTIGKAETLRSLSVKFGVSIGAIQHVLDGTSWREERAPFVRLARAS